MCIICNAGIDFRAIEAAERYLHAYELSRQAMKKAADAMLAVTVAIPLHHSRYDRIHKAMVHLSREWNKLEQQHEADHVPSDGVER